MPSTSAGAVDGQLLTNDLIHNSAELNAAASPAVRWLAGGTAYTALERPAAALLHGGDEKEEQAEGVRSAEEGTPGGSGDDVAAGTGGGGPGARAREIVRYDALSGERSLLVSLDALTPAGATKPLEIHDYAWSDDGNRLLVFTNSVKVWRQNTRGDYFVVDVSGGGAPIIQLGGGADWEPQCLMFAKFAPLGSGGDNRDYRVGFVYQNNVYVQSLADMAVVQLTHDGLPGHGGMAPVINGNFDWVYEVSRAFPSWKRSILTEMYLCRACSC
jgi:hypothetical protein